MGGWRAYGIDPGEFSSYLMRTCERLVQMGHFKLSEPSDLLAKSYYELLEHKKPILGEKLHSYVPNYCYKLNRTWTTYENETCIND